MGKRNFEGRWLEYCEGEPIASVETLLKLGHSVLNRRKKQQRMNPARFTMLNKNNEKTHNAPAELPEHPAPPDSAELFEREADGEIKAPF